MLVKFAKLSCSVLSFLYVPFLFTNQAWAGAYSGAEFDHNNTSLYFAGTQTNDPLYVGVFIGELEYQFPEAGENVSVSASIITPSVGYRFEGPITLSFTAGVSFNDETERRAGTVDKSSRSGAVIQFGMSHYSADYNVELLSSYNDTTEFIWARSRTKMRIHSVYYGGVELFFMGNDDFESQGLAMLFEKTGNILSGLIKVGVSDIKDVGQGLYGGIELSIPF